MRKNIPNIQCNEISFEVEIFFPIIMAKYIFVLLCHFTTLCLIWINSYSLFGGLCDSILSILNFISVQMIFSSLFIPISCILSYCNIISFYLIISLFPSMVLFLSTAELIPLKCHVWDVHMCTSKPWPACIGQRRTCKNQVSPYNHVSSLNWNYFNRKF